MRDALYESARMEIPASVPGWYEILKSAEAWSTPPWKITGDGHRLLWHLRRVIVDREITRGTNERRKAQAERQRNL